MNKIQLNLSISIFLLVLLIYQVQAGIKSRENSKATLLKMQLCPELANKSKYTVWAARYDNRTASCYMTGQRGPCGRNMVFYSLRDDPIFGECDCNYDVECKSLIYSSTFNECFYAYEQGHCNEGYWLTSSVDGKPVCERNPCRPTQKYSLKYQWALYKGRCEKLYHPVPDCLPGEYLWVPKGQRYPVCGRQECKREHSFIPLLECELGSKLYYESRCTRRKNI